MEPWPHPCAFHKFYPSFYVQDTPGCPNHCSLEWRTSFPKFNGDPALAITHVINYMKYASSLDVLDEDVMHGDVIMNIFVSSLELSQRNFLARSCKPKSIPSSTKIVE
jgi:hypothetical protein